MEAASRGGAAPRANPVAEAAAKRSGLEMDMRSASIGLDKDRAAQKLMQNLRALVSRETYEFIEESVKDNCGDSTDRFVMCVMAQMKKIDPCLGRRCVMRIKDMSPATLAATEKCTCANGAGSVSGEVLRKGQKRGVDAMGTDLAPSGFACKSAKCKLGDAPAPVASAPNLVRLANENDVKRLEALLCGGVDVNKRDQRGLTALMVASIKGHVQAVKTLLMYSARLEAKDSIAGRTALMWAVTNNRLEVVKELVCAGADIETVATDGSNPLLTSARNGYVAIARLLVQRGAKLDGRDCCGFTPLMFAASFGKTEVVTLLAQKKAEMDHKDRRGCTPLILAARSGRSDTALALAEIGCDVACTCEHGNNVLHHAARNGHATTLRALLSSAAASKACANLIHARNILGYTPLLAAAEAGRIDCAAILLEHGARIEDRNSHGLDAMQLARLEGHEDVAKLLREGLRKRVPQVPAAAAR